MTSHVVLENGNPNTFTSPTSLMNPSFSFIATFWRGSRRCGATLRLPNTWSSSPNRCSQMKKKNRDSTRRCGLAIGGKLSRCVMPVASVVVILIMHVGSSARGRYTCRSRRLHRQDPTHSILWWTSRISGLLVLGQPSELDSSQAIRTGLHSHRISSLREDLQSQPHQGPAREALPTVLPRCHDRSIRAACQGWPGWC